MTHINTNQISFGAITKLAREIYFKNFVWFLLLNIVAQITLFTIMYLLYLPVKNIPEALAPVYFLLAPFLILVMGPVLILLFGTIFCFSCIDHNFRELIKLLSPRFYKQHISTIGLCLGLLFCIIVIYGMFSFIFLPFLFTLPSVTSIMTFPLQRRWFLMLDRNIPVENYDNILEKLTTDEKEPVTLFFKHLKIPTICVYTSIWGMISWLIFCKLISIDCSTDYPFSKMGIAPDALLPLALFIFSASVCYLLLVNIVLYRVRVSSYFDDMKSVEEIENWSEVK